MLTDIRRTTNVSLSTKDLYYLMDTDNKKLHTK